MIPSFRSFLKIILALGLLWLYWVAPTRWKKENPHPIQVDLSNVVSMTCTDGKERVWLENQEQRGWRFQPAFAQKPDPDLLQNLFWLLNISRYKISSDIFPDPAPYIELEDAQGKRQTIEIGSRLEPFRKQLVRIDDVVYEINHDLGACLGLWDYESRPPLLARLGAPSVFSVDPGSIVAVEYSNRLVRYRFEEKNGRWSLAAIPAVVIIPERMDHYIEQISWVSSYPSPVPAGLREDEFPEKLTLRIAGGKTWKFSLTLPSGKGFLLQSLVRMDGPDGTMDFRIDAASYYRLVPSMSDLVRNLPGFGVDPEDMTELAVQRGNQSFTLKNKNGQWTVEKPERQAKLAMMENEMGKKEPVINGYVKYIGSVKSREWLSPQTAVQPAILKNGPADGTITIHSKKGGPVTARLSKPIEGTDSRILRLDHGNSMVVSEDETGILFPDPETFFQRK